MVDNGTVASMQPKIPPERISSDDCEIHTGTVVQDGEVVNQGKSHFPHQREWIEIIPIISVGEIISVGRMQRGADDDGANAAQLLGDEFEALCVKLAGRIWEWNWTDLFGRPYEQPFEHPEVLKNLSSEELVYLVGVTSANESAESRKNGSGGSGGTSSTQQRPRSRQKAS